MQEHCLLKYSLKIVFKIICFCLNLTIFIVVLIERNGPHPWPEQKYYFYNKQIGNLMYPAQSLCKQAIGEELFVSE